MYAHLRRLSISFWLYCFRFLRLFWEIFLFEPRATFIPDDLFGQGALWAHIKTVKAKTLKVFLTQIPSRWWDLTQSVSPTHLLLWVKWGTCWGLAHSSKGGHAIPIPIPITIHQILAKSGFRADTDQCNNFLKAYRMMTKFGLKLG